MSKYYTTFRETVGVDKLFSIHEIHDSGLDILSEAGLPSTNFLILVTYGTSSISVVFGVMNFLCFSPKKVINLTGCWETFSTFLICFVTPIIRKCFYGLCAFHLIVHVALSEYRSTEITKTEGTTTMPSVFDAKEGGNFTSNKTIAVSTGNNTLNETLIVGMDNITMDSQSAGRSILRTNIGEDQMNCSSNASNDEYVRTMEEHTWFYFYILLSSLVPSLVLALMSLFTTTHFKYAIKAIFKYPLVVSAPLVMPFVFQGVNSTTSMTKSQSADMLEWKTGSKIITLSMWATDINFLNIVLDGVFGCMFAALSTEFEQLCLDEMIEKNMYFTYLMWAGLGLKLLLHLLILLIKLGCPENILTPSYKKLGTINLDEFDVIDNKSFNSTEEIEFGHEPGRCRLCFGRFVAFIGIILGVCGTLAIFVAFFIFVYGGFGIKGIKEVELTNVVEIAKFYGRHAGIPLIVLFIPSLMVLWSCLRAQSQSHKTKFTNTSCCLRRSTSAFFLLILAFGTIILPAGMVFAVIIAGKYQIEMQTKMIPGYLMGITMAVVILLLSFTCLIPSCCYFLWNKGFRRGVSKSKECWFEENDERFTEEVKEMKSQSKIRTHTTVQPFLSVAPLEGNRIDSFIDTNLGPNMNTDMNINTSLLETVEEEPHTKIPTPSKRTSNKYLKAESPRVDSIRGPNRGQDATIPMQNMRSIDTVYENESAVAMISPIHNTSTIPNAPPLPNTPTLSFQVDGRVQEENRMLQIDNNVSSQNYCQDDIPYVVP